MNKRFLALVGVMFATAAMRIIPHPWNLTPVAGMALFAGAHFEDRTTAFLIPLGALLMSDLLLGFYPGAWVVYGSFALIVCLGMAIKTKRTPAVVLGASMTSSILFFILTNFGDWFIRRAYPMNGEGLLACYTAAIPFFRNTLLGDLLYSAALFGSFNWAERRFPALQASLQK